MAVFYLAGNIFFNMINPETFLNYKMPHSKCGYKEGEKETQSHFIYKVHYYFRTPRVIECMFFHSVLN